MKLNQHAISLLFSSKYFVFNFRNEPYLKIVHLEMNHM